MRKSELKQIIREVIEESVNPLPSISDLEKRKRIRKEYRFKPDNYEKDVPVVVEAKLVYLVKLTEDGNIEHQAEFDTAEEAYKEFEYYNKITEDFASHGTLSEED